ncbi:MAG: CapA family protein, partial [Bacillus cereus]|nr:CapA family protein [Bacillus cereus]
EIKKLFDDCYVRICNIEAPCEIRPTDKTIEKRGPAIHQGEHFLEYIEKIGFNLASIANNHILDYGESVLKRTIEGLNSVGVTTIGAGFSFEDVYKPYIIEQDNQKIAFISGSQAEFGVFKSQKERVGYAWINHPYMHELIRQAKKNADLVYVLAHAGLENIPYPLPEWRSIYKELIDIGADCIIGSHPHIRQGYEMYKDKYIFYSLGNFFFDHSNSKYDTEKGKGLIVICDTQNISQINIIPFKIENNQIVIDYSNETNKIMDERSAIFANEKQYIDQIDEIAETYWKQYYSKYYEWYTPTDINHLRIKNIIKHVLKRLLKKDTINYRSNIDETMLLHNIQIETHRWIVERYLYNKNIKQNNF